MPDYKFELNGRNINKNILNFEYSEDLEDIASSFSFTSLTDFGLTSINQNGETRINVVKIYKNGQTEPYYVGVITDYEHTKDKYVYSYEGFDVGFYLNKNEVIKHFKGVNIGKAIESICSEYNITLNNQNFTKDVKKIYKNRVFADVIKELIQFEKDKGGLKDLYIDCKNGRLNIRQYTKEDDLTSLIGNGFLVKSDKTYNNVSVKQSIQELKNRVVYTDNNEKSLLRVQKENPASIATYGLLTEIETIDTNKENNLTKLAEQKLDELNRIKEERSLELLGDYRISKGKLIDFINSDYGLNGVYLITSAKHKINSEKEIVEVEIQRFNK